MSHTTEAEAVGAVAEGYETVAEAFGQNLADHGEIGAALCVHVDGAPVVDIAGGRTTDGDPYTADTLQLMFSATKGVLAVVASMLEQRGLLDLDAPVAENWPEFAAGGKEQIPVSWVLSHQAGLAAPPRSYPIEELLDGTGPVEDLAAMEPIWEPGTRHGYHAVTFGWLVGEVVRRVTGRSIGKFVAEEIADPLGLDLWIGLPETQEHRVAPVIAPRPPTPQTVELLGDAMAPGGLGLRALTAGGSIDMASVAEFYNQRVVRAAEFPAGNGVGTARSLSRMYAACIGEIGGVRLLEPRQVDRARATWVRGPDEVWGFETAFGLGFWLHTDLHPKLGPGSFGHSGPTSLGFADPESGVAFGYMANQAGNLVGDARLANLLAALRSCLGR